MPSCPDPLLWWWARVAGHTLTALRLTWPAGLAALAMLMAAAAALRASPGLPPGAATSKK
jgi:hypothetical protein